MSMSRKRNTSFKTHDPFVMLEHLEGNISSHAASFCLCALVYVDRFKLDYQPTGFESMISYLMLSHLSIICLQITSRYFKEKEANVVTKQYSKDPKESKKDKKD